MGNMNGIVIFRREEERLLRIEFLLQFFRDRFHGIDFVLLTATARGRRRYGRIGFTRIQSVGRRR